MLCTSLGLLPFSSQSFSFTIYGILSGALLATGTSITFVSQNTLGTTTAYSLVVAGGMLTRFGWEVLFLNSFDLDFFFFLPVAMLIGGVVACIKLHERNVRFGLASVSLDFFGVREVATVSVHVTSVPMLKAQIRRHFWEAYVDVGNIDTLFLIDGTDEVVELRRIAQLAPTFDSAELRVVGTVALLKEEVGRSDEDDTSDSGSSSTESSRSPLTSMKATGAFSDLAEINKRIALSNSAAGFHTKRAKLAALQTGARRRRLQYCAALLGGVCLGSVMVPALHDHHAVDRMTMVSYLPLVGLGAFFVAPTIPGDKFASCVSFHLSRASNMNPLDAPGAVVVSSLFSGFLWAISAVASAHCAGESKAELLYLILPGAAGVNMALGICCFKEFEENGARLHWAAVFAVLSAAGAAMAHLGGARVNGFFI